MTRGTLEIQNQYRILRDKEQRQIRKIQKIKLAIFTINLFLFVIACLGGALSTYALLEFKALYLEDVVRNVTIITVVTWVVPICCVVCFLLIPMCGCHGVIAQKEGVIVSYFVFLLLLLVMSLVVCVLAVVGADMITDKLKEAITEAVEAYPTDHGSRLGLEEIQRTFGCCGADVGMQEFGRWGPPPSCTMDNFFKPCNVEVFRHRELYRYTIVAVSAFLALVLLICMVLCMTLVHHLRALANFDGPARLSGFDNINYIVAERTNGHAITPSESVRC